MEFNVINFCAVSAANLVGGERLADGPGEADELVQILPLDGI